jgi:localization factor PodJL
MEREPTAAGEKPAGSTTFGAIARKLTGRRALILAAILVASIGALHAALNFGGEESVPLSAGAPKRVATTAIAPPEKLAEKITIARPNAPRSDAAVGPREAAPSVTNTLANPPAPTTGASETSAPTINPWTMAANPSGNDLTSAIGRATGLSHPPAAGPPSLTAQPSELPEAFPRGLRSAALTGNAAAEYEIGVRYAEGRGVTLNYEEAARWFERAANRNLAPAQYRLGSLYEKGNGVKKDLDQARRLYRAAADAGNGKAMHNLAVLYAEGLEGKPDFRNAAEWFRQAAMRGIADSQYNVAILYARGLGVEQNLAESYKWFALAAQRGDQDAAKKRDDVSARLEPAQLTAAQQAAQSFKAQQQPDDAVSVAGPEGGWENTATPAKPKPGGNRRRTQT